MSLFIWHSWCMRAQPVLKSIRLIVSISSTRVVLIKYSSVIKQQLFRYVTKLVSCCCFWLRVRTYIPIMNKKKQILYDCVFELHGLPLPLSFCKETSLRFISDAGFVLVKLASGQLYVPFDKARTFIAKRSNLLFRNRSLTTTKITCIPFNLLI